MTVLPKYVEQWENAIRDKLFLKLLALLLVLALIANGLFRRATNRVVIYPPEVKQEFWVGQRSASKQYLVQMALMYLHFLLDINPRNADSFASFVIKNLTGDKVSKIETAILQDVMYVKDNDIYQYFYPETIKVVGKKEVRVTGQVKREIAGKEVIERDVCYRVVFKISGMQLRVSDIGPCPRDED